MIPVPILLALLPARCPTAALQVELVPGGAREETLSGDEVRFELLVDEPGPLTVRAESFAVDVRVEVTLPEGTPVAGADTGGLGTDAWLVFEAEARAYVVVVSSPARLPGPFRIAVDRGRTQLEQGDGRELAELEYWERATEAARERGDVVRRSRALARVGTLALSLGRYPLALESYAAAEELALAHGSPDEALFARSFVGIVKASLGRHSEALIELERVREEIPLREAGLRALVQRTLAETLVALGRFEDAGHEYDQLLGFATEHALPWDQVFALCGLGTVEMQSGRTDAALERYEAACRRAEPFGPDVLAKARLELAHFLLAMGELDRARETITVALHEMHTDLARADLLGSLGRIEEEAGHLARAREHYLDALSACERVGYERGSVLSLTRLAHVAWRLADYDGALERIEDARALSLGRDVEVQLLGELGLVKSAKGDREGALEAHASAVALALSTGLVEARLRANVDLAVAELEVGRLEQARATLQATLAEAALLNDAELCAYASTNLGYIELLSGDPEHALEHALGALATLRELGRTELQLHPLETIARASIRLGRVDDAWNAIEQAELVLETTGGAGLSSDETSRFRSRHAWWAETLVQDALALELERSTLSQEERERAIVRGLDEAGSWKGRALRQALRARHALPGTPSLGELRGTLLTEGTALVEYAAGSQRLFAYAVDDRNLTFTDLGERAPLEARAEAFIRLVQSCGPLEETIAAGAELYTRLLAPVLESLGSSPETLVVVPTAQLTGMPFEALVSRAGGDHGPEYVLDRFLVVTCPSTAVLRELADAPSPGRRGVLLLADPVYADELSVESRGDGPSHAESFPRLPETRSEVEAITRLFVADEATRDGALRGIFEARSGILRTDAVTVRLGTEASARRLIEDLPSCSILHVGAHGYVDTEDPLLCGLALAHDETGPASVSTRDIMELELDLELAVLSACDTARGPIRGGEGVLSLARAFLHAGARSVVASLWQVQDRDMAILMQAFYADWLTRGAHPALALRAAKQALRTASRDGAMDVARGRPLRVSPVGGQGHPYSWASCVFVGAPPR